MAAAMTAAALDLPIDKNLGFAHIVPYCGLATFQMGYKGLIQLGLRSGQYQRMNAVAVNAEAYQGRDEVGEPIIDWDKVDDTKPIVGYAFAFKLVNGFVKVAYWRRDMVEAHARKYSQAYKGGRETPWKTHFDAMALKTVIANELRKWGILSVQMQTALHRDMTAQRDLDADIIYPDAEADHVEIAPARPIFAQATPTPTTSEDDAELAAAGLAPATEDEALRSAGFTPPGPEQAPNPRRGRPPGSKNKPKEPAETPVAPPAEQPPAPTISEGETANERMARIVHTLGGVTFDDFRDWLVTTQRAQRNVVDAWASMDDVPEAMCISLLDDTVALKRCVQIFGSLEKLAAGLTPQEVIIYSLVPQWEKATGQKFQFPK
jgi:recombinational DNA repair protein RecT